MFNILDGSKLRTGTFKRAIHPLIEHKLDLQVLQKYRNEETALYYFFMTREYFLFENLRIINFDAKS